MDASAARYKRLIRLYRMSKAAYRAQGGCARNLSKSGRLCAPYRFGQLAFAYTVLAGTTGAVLPPSLAFFPFYGAAKDTPRLGRVR